MVDIERLSLEELIDLNKRIVHRMRYLSELKTGAKLNRFEVGDRVSFQNGGATVEGVVVRVNRKSLSVRTKTTLWRIHPDLVKKSPAADAGSFPEYSPLPDLRISQN